jgi:hypothetical protein
VTRRIDGVVFPSEDALLGAAAACRARGFEVVDVHSPYPIHGIDEIAGIRRTRLPAVTLVAGGAGLALGTWLQFWTSATDWPVNVGGKPWDSMPAFLPVSFEITVLLAGLATVAALLLRCRLRPGRTPRVEGLGTTDDRFALLVASPPGAWADADLRRFWTGLGAERTFTLPAGEGGR